MPKGKWIDRKTAQHFTLVHRPQNDPLIHDSDAPAMVLNPTNLPNASKVKKLDDLASELGSDADHIRANEGEAANYGVYFDDTEYDYMQHLRDLDQGGGGQVTFIEAKQPEDKGKGKQKQSLEDALKQLDIQAEEEKQSKGLGEDFLPSRNLQRTTYQDQQNVPDVIGGFQPDMDPRLREVLEALEDDAYVDDDDDLFQALAEDGQELDDFGDEDIWGDEDDGWESDGTAKPTREYRDSGEAPALVAVDGGLADPRSEQPAEGPGNDWMEDFKKFKADEKAGKVPSKAPLAARAGAPSVSDVQSSMMTTTTNGGRKKKRKGALTSTSSYSMSSSSLVRTEQLNMLDERFEKFTESKYDPSFDEGDEIDFPLDDDDVMSRAPSQFSTASSVTGNVRNDFDGILDDFLGNHSQKGKKHIRKGKVQGALAELDEVRRGLGPARVGKKYGVAQRAQGGGLPGGVPGVVNPFAGISATRN